MNEATLNLRLPADVRPGRVRPIAGAAWRWLVRAIEVYRERRALAEMDTRQLQDIGIDRIEARREAWRAPWDLPRR